MCRRFCCNWRSHMPAIRCVRRRGMQCSSNLHGQNHERRRDRYRLWWILSPMPELRFTGSQLTHRLQWHPCERCLLSRMQPWIRLVRAISVWTNWTVFGWDVQPYPGFKCSWHRPLVCVRCAGPIVRLHPLQRRTVLSRCVVAKWPGLYLGGCWAPS